MKEKYLSFDEKPYLNTVIEKYKKKKYCRCGFQPNLIFNMLKVFGLGS